jgi:hypothetical protein
MPHGWLNPFLLVKKNSMELVDFPSPLTRSLFTTNKYGLGNGMGDMRIRFKGNNWNNVSLGKVVQIGPDHIQHGRI